MRLAAEHDFPATCAEVAELLCDPAFHVGLDLPDLSRPEVVAHSADAATRQLRLRYQYVGQLDPVARRIVGDRRLVWVQDLSLDTTTYTGMLTFSAEPDQQRLRAAATVAIVPIEGGAHARRRIEGELRVNVPLIGGTLEQRLAPGVLRRLDVEAAAMSDELAAHR